MGLAGKRLAAAWVLWLPVAVAICTASPARSQRLEGVPADTTVGTANGESVTAGELMHELTSRFGQGALQEMVIEWTVDEEATRRGVLVSDDEVLRAACERLSSPERTLTTREELVAACKDEGVDADLLLIDVRYELLLDRVLSKAAVVTENELRELFELQPDTFAISRAHVRMILFRTEKDVQGLLPGLTAGTLPDLARQFSADEAHREAGGDWGWVRPEELPDVPELRALVGTARLGRLSPPIRTPDGWVIAVVEDRKVDAPQTFEQARDRVLAVATEQKKAELYNGWQERARKIAGLLTLDAGIGAVAPLPPPEDAQRLEEMSRRFETTKTEEESQVVPGQ